MESYISVLQRTQMFSGVNERDIATMISCLNARQRHYQKGMYVLREGEWVDDIAILMEGSLHIQKDDYWGNRSILGEIVPGEMFLEAYAGPQSNSAQNDVVAIEDSTVIFFDIKRVLSACFPACKYHSIVVQNLFFAISEKNRKLVQKLSYLSKRSTREKLISYLSEESKRRNSDKFMIPYNRQQLADYLSVDRSAMSKELCKLRDEGLLTFDKNHFELF